MERAAELGSGWVGGGMQRREWGRRIEEHRAVESGQMRLSRLGDGVEARGATSIW